MKRTKFDVITSFQQTVRRELKAKREEAIYWVFSSFMCDVNVLKRAETMFSDAS
jgi:hypothetical protein